MNEQVTDDPTTTRKLTDAALLIVAIAAVASWLWRRLRRPAGVGATTDAAQEHDEKVGGAVGSPANNAPV